MKRSKLIQLLLAVTAVATLQIACATPEPAANTSNATTPTPQATPDTAAITAEITKIENDWPRVIKEKDGAAVRRIEADDAILVYPDGSSGNKAQDIKDIEAGNLTYDSWEILELNVKVLDADAAMAILHFSVKNGKYKSPDGKSQDISGQYRLIDTFVRRNGQWQIIGSATTPVRSPVAAPTASPKAPTAEASPAAKAAPTRRTAPPPPPAKTP